MNETMIKIQKTKRRNVLFLILAIVLILITCYKLKIKGITMTEDLVYESVLACENVDETHVHSEECYELVAVSSSENVVSENITNTIISEENNAENTDITEQLNNTEDVIVSENENVETDVSINTSQTDISDSNDLSSSDIINVEQDLLETDTDLQTNEEIQDTTSSIDSLSTDNQVSILALDESTSTSNNAVNVYLYIDDAWVSIGYTTKSNTNNTSFRVNTSNITNMISEKLGLDLTTNDFSVYHSVGTGTTYYKANINTNNGTSRYTLNGNNQGNSSTYRNIYIVSTSVSGNKNYNNLTSSNTLKFYSITELDETGNEVSSSYVYTSNNTATYTLPSNYNYIVNNDSNNVIVGGESIDVSQATTIQRVNVPTSTVTIYDENGNISQTKTVIQNSEYIIPNGYWYVNGSNEETSGGATIIVASDTDLRPVTYLVTVNKVGSTAPEYVNVKKGGSYTLGSNLKWKVTVGDSSVTYNGGSTITINAPTTVEEINQITITYTVDLSKAATTLNETQFLYDGIAVPTIGESGEKTYTITVEYNNGIITEKLTDNFVTPYDNDKVTDSGYHTYVRSVLEFMGWKVNDSDTDIVNSEVELSWNDLYQYAVNGVVNLSTTWDLKPSTEHANFYLRYDSFAIDIEDEIETNRGSENYTPSLWATYVGNYSTDFEDIADTDYDNSYTANSRIRALEGDKGNGSLYLYSVPTDDYVFEQLKKYADNITLDGEKVVVEELNSEHYEIRWYVFKEQGDCWHIDGKLVRREGKIVLNKTFSGSKAAIEAVTGYDFETKTQGSSNYYIELVGEENNRQLYISTAEVQDNTTTTTGEDGTTNSTYSLTYTWTINVKYGIDYTVTEKEYVVKDYIVDTTNNIYDPQGTKYKKVYNSDGSFTWAVDGNGERIPVYTNQTTSTKTGDSTTVKGINNYAVDSGELVTNDKLINVNFSNTYAPTSAITLKKVDSITNSGLKNAQFSIYEVVDGVQSTVPLKFSYNESIYTYNESGNYTVLTSPTGGSIIINGLPTDKTYKVKEVGVPTGYDEETAVEVELKPGVDGSGNNIIIPVVPTGSKYDSTTKVLEVDNASKLTSVEVSKVWDEDVPNAYRKAVTLDLYLNNIPIQKYDLNGDGIVNTDDIAQYRVILNDSNSWKYEWNSLPLYINGEKAIYTVREVKIGDLAALTDGEYDSATGTWSSGDAYTQYSAQTTPQKETIVNDEVTKLSFNIENTIHLIKIDINKITPLGKALEGATFKLNRLNDNGDIDTTFETKFATTDANGKIAFADLEYNTKYVIQETVAPEDHYLEDTKMYIMINQGVDGGEDTLTLYKDASFTEVVEAGENGKVSLNEFISLTSDSTAINVINISYIEMPKAGGCGTQWFYIMGIFLMGSSIVIIYLKNKIKKGM